jgi:hypothetical protein
MNCDLKREFHLLPPAQKKCCLEQREMALFEMNSGHPSGCLDLSLKRQPIRALLMSILLKSRIIQSVEE